MNDCIDDDYGAAAADIPSIVQRALGMQNLKQNPSIASNNHNHHVICGLEGYLLPRYLSLRTGNNNNYCNNSDDNCMPDMLVRAQSEEMRSRRQCRVVERRQQSKAKASSDAPRATKCCTNSKINNVGSRL